MTDWGDTLVKRYQPPASRGGRYASLEQSLRRDARFVGASLRGIGETRVGDILRIDYRSDNPYLPVVMIAAGQHGEEPAGSLMIADEFRLLVAYAKALGLGLVIYPCINPEGFDAKTRYNANGERNTNDFIEYLVDGKWVGELPASDKQGVNYTRWRTVDDSDIAHETAALKNDLETDDAPAAIIDLHQDHKEGSGEAYTWIEGVPRSELVTIQRGVITDPCRNTALDLPWTSEKVTTDSDGLCTLYDGTLQDYVYRKGARWAVTLETRNDAPLMRTKAIAFRWTLSLMHLVARTGKARP